MITEFKYLPNFTVFSRLTDGNKLYIKIGSSLAIPKKDKVTDDVKPFTIMPTERVVKLGKKEKS